MEKHEFWSRLENYSYQPKIFKIFFFTVGHGSHQHVHTEIIERIDEVIELVDCGGRDLGFCDMNSKYPG